MFRRFTLVLALVFAAGSLGVKVSSAEESIQLRSLLRARLQTAQQGWQRIERTSSARQLDYPQARLWSDRLAEAELALAATPLDRELALESQLTRARYFEAFVKSQAAKGAFTPIELNEAEYHRLEVELRLLQIRGVKFATRP